VCRITPPADYARNCENCEKGPYMDGRWSVVNPGECGGRVDRKSNSVLFDLENQTAGI
jgi:hypothetical protein